MRFVNSVNEEHARLSPSNHRWVYCPGSIREESIYPDIPGESAIDGTGSHLLLELCLTHNTRAEYFLNEVIGVGHKDKPNGWIVRQDRCDRVNVCVDYVNRRKKELTKDNHDGVVKIETESKSIPSTRDDWWGTVDITISVFIQDLGIVFTEVVDFKDGRSFVNHINNPQLVAYLNGKRSKDPYEKLRMTIVQPKTQPPIRYTDVTVEELNKEIIKLEEAAKRTDDPDAPLIPDDKDGKGYCRWCKHFNNCEARKEKTMGNIKGVEKLLSQDVSTMDNETLSNILNIKPLIQIIFKQVEEKAQQSIENGQYVPGYTMRPGNSSKSWAISEDELVKKLKACKFKKEEIYTQKLISPAQVLKHENLTKKQKERFQTEYIKSVPGALKLKPVITQDREKEVIDEFKDVVLQCNTSISFI